MERNYQNLGQILTFYHSNFTSKGDWRKLSNHQDIFITPITSKVFEKNLMLHQLKENLHIVSFKVVAKVNIVSLTIRCIPSHL